MGKTRWAVGAVLVLGLVLGLLSMAWVAVHRSSGSGAEDAVTGARSPAAAAGRDKPLFAGQAGAAPDGPADGPPASSAHPPNPFAHLPRTRAGMPFDGDPFVAESTQEQQWLDRNGYPNAQQLMAYETAPDGLLEQAAAAGDDLAAVLLDSRRLISGDQAAADRLFHAAAEGSMFALSRLQAYMAGSPKGDPAYAYALYRLMQLKGDTRAIGEGNFRTPLDEWQRLQGDALAHQLLARLERDFPGVRHVDPRPASLAEIPCQPGTSGSTACLIRHLRDQDPRHF